MKFKAILVTVWLRVLTACYPYVVDQKCQDARMKMLWNRLKSGKL